MTETCERCGWEHVELPPPEIEDWPEDLPPPPPLPSSMEQHPAGVCCSPFAIGASVFWDLGGANPDLPPILGRFQKLVEIVGPTYHLEGRNWVMDSSPKPVRAIFCVEASSIIQEHKEIFGPTLKEPFETNICCLTAAARWPVLT